MSAFVQNQGVQNTGSSLSGATITGTTAGNGLIFFLCLNLGVSVNGLSFTMSGELPDGATIPVLLDVAAGRRVYAGFVKALASGGSKTLAANFSGATNWGCTFVEVSGQDTVTFIDTYGQANDGPTTNQDVDATLSTTAANEMVVGMISLGGNAPTLVTGTYTSFTATGGTSEHLALGAYDNDVGAAGLQTLTFNGIGTGSSAFIQMIAIKNFAVAAVAPNSNEAVSVAESVTPNVINMPKGYNFRGIRDLWENEKGIWTRQPVVYRPA